VNLFTLLLDSNQGHHAVKKCGTQRSYGAKGANC